LLKAADPAGTLGVTALHPHPSGSRTGHDAAMLAVGA
jgi:hypothetical protein